MKKKYYFDEKNHKKTWPILLYILSTQMRRRALLQFVKSSVMERLLIWHLIQKWESVAREQQPKLGYLRVTAKIRI